MDNVNDIVNEVAKSVDSVQNVPQVDTTVVPTVEQTVAPTTESATVQNVQPIENIAESEINSTIQGDSDTSKKTLNEVAMEIELENRTAEREKELNDFMSKEMPSGLNTSSINIQDGNAVSEIPTLDKEMSKELEDKLKESKKFEEAMRLNRELIKQYKILENRLKDTIDIANDRIKLANSVYKEEAEKNIKNMSDPKRVVLDDKMYLLNSIRNDYKADKSEANKQKLAQNLVLLLGTLYPTVNPNDMINFINNSQKRINNIGEDRVSAQSVRSVPTRPTISRPRGIAKSQRGMLG